MMFFLQIISILFALTMIYFALLNYRRKELSINEIFTWMMIWVGVIFTIIFPDILRKFAETFFFARLFDMLVVGGFILVIMMVAKNYVTMNRLEKKLEKYVRKEALGKRKNTKS